ncbi:hypothetical protein G9A89_005651 [Geosiphon pyriformis]|nr:hypothetical protein G9A89_005651 [Geosiphon pyriformis]
MIFRHDVTNRYRYQPNTEKKDKTPPITETVGGAAAKVDSAELNAVTSHEKNEEYEQHCLLFPTYATRQDEKGESDNWHIRVRGWAFASPKNSRTRDLFLNITSWATGLKPGDENAKKMAIEGDPTDAPAAETHAIKQDEPKVQQILENAQQIHVLNHPVWETKFIKIIPKEGNFSGIIPIAKDIIDKWIGKEEKKEKPNWFQSLFSFDTKAKQPSIADKVRMIKLQAYHTEMGLPAYGVVNLIEPEGYSVISDIDDTIKDTDISAGAKVVFSNTFLHKFKDVAGMAKVYKFWYDKGAGIHYVSNSPWQLFPMIRGFFETYEFPPGSAHLKFYDGLIKSAVQQKENPMASKFMYIRELLKDFPKRKYILVGDTGELDPEIYTQIARENPGRILKIFIRDVTTSRVKDLPAQEPHHSYIQTFPSMIGHLKSYYSSSEKPKSESSNSNEEDEPHKPERSGSFSSALFDKLHTDISYLYEGTTNDKNGTPNPNHNAAVSSLFKPAAAKTPLKTPLEMFQERIRLLTKGLPENLFFLFTEADQLQNDPIVKKALQY